MTLKNPGEPIILTATVGPLEVNYKIENKVIDILEKGYGEIKATLQEVGQDDEGNASIKSSELTIISLDKEQMTVKKVDSGEVVCEVGYDIEYPEIEIIKKSNNHFRLLLDSKRHLQMISDDNKSRDILALSLRLFCSESVIASLGVLDEDGKEGG